MSRPRLMKWGDTWAITVPPGTSAELVDEMLDNLPPEVKHKKVEILDLNLVNNEGLRTVPLKHSPVALAFDNLLGKPNP